MKRCPVCGKDKSEFEMRPIVNVEELAMGDAVSDVDSKEDVGGAKLHVVCRACWLALLESRSKEEIVELLETIAGILFEVARVQIRVPQMSEVIEKFKKMPMIPSPSVPQIQPLTYPQPQIAPGGWGTGVSDGSSMPLGGGQWQNGTRIDLSSGGNSSTANLAEQFGNLMFGEDFHLGPNWTEGDNDAGEPVSSE